jgi:hypothetical protein
VPENAKASFNETMLLPIAAGILRLEESNDGLGNGEAASHREIPPGKDTANWG